MIDVQAQLKSLHRCVVTPEARIVGMIVVRQNLLIPDKCRNHPFGFMSRAEVDPNNPKLDPIYPGVDERWQNLWVSTDGSTLYSWNSVSEYRDNGREKRDRSTEGVIGEYSTGEWRPNMWYHMQCIAWLLNVEDFESGEWQKRSGSM